MNELERKIGEAIRRIDEVASGRGLRAAQRRSLEKCKWMLARIYDKIEKADKEEYPHLLESILAVMARRCELVNAYFTRGER